MISEVLRKREMQCVFQDEWFQPDTGREEKSNLASQKTAGSARASCIFPNGSCAGCLK